MFEIGTIVKLDEGGWLVQSTSETDRIGVVCGYPDTVACKIAVSIDSSPGQSIEFFYRASTTAPAIVKERRTLAQLHHLYTNPKPKKSSVKDPVTPE